MTNLTLLRCYYHDDDKDDGDNAAVQYGHKSLLLNLTCWLIANCCYCDTRSATIGRLPSVVAKAKTLAMLSATTGGCERGREADGREGL